MSFNMRWCENGIYFYIKGKDIEQWENILEQTASVERLT